MQNLFQFALAVFLRERIMKTIAVSPKIGAQSRARPPLSASPNRVRKSSKEKRERRSALERLRLMVGDDENTNQLEIMQANYRLFVANANQNISFQHVIDYICYLRATLGRCAVDECEFCRQAEAPIISELNVQLTTILSRGA